MHYLTRMLPVLFAACIALGSQPPASGCTTNCSCMLRCDGLGNRFEQLALLDTEKYPDIAPWFPETSDGGVRAPYTGWGKFLAWRSFRGLREAPCNYTTNNLPKSCSKFGNIHVKRRNSTKHSASSFQSWKRNILSRNLRHLKPNSDIWGLRFPNNARPIGVHIRAGDKLTGHGPLKLEPAPSGRTGLYFTKDELIFSIHAIASAINDLMLDTNTGGSLFIAAENKRWRDLLLHLLRPNAQRAVVKPVVKLRGDDAVPNALIDWFGLTLCSDIFSASPWSSFSSTAALRANVTLWHVFEDEYYSPGNAHRSGKLDVNRWPYKRAKVPISLRTNFALWNTTKAKALQSEKVYNLVAIPRFR